MKRLFLALAVCAFAWPAGSSPSWAQVTLDQLFERQGTLEQTLQGIGQAQSGLTDELDTLSGQAGNIRADLEAADAEAAGIRVDLEALRDGPDPDPDPDPDPGDDGRMLPLFVEQDLVIANDVLEPAKPITRATLQAALDAVSGVKPSASNPRARQSTVYVPGGRHNINGTVRLVSGKGLVGNGPRNTHLDGNGHDGDCLLVENATGNQFLHAAWFRHLQVFGCKGAQIHVKGAMGENTYGSYFWVSGGDAGLRMSDRAANSTPAFWGPFSAFASRWCVDVTGNVLTHVQFAYVSGDDCRGAHLRLKQARSVAYLGYKHELVPDRPPSEGVFRIDGVRAGGGVFFGPGTLMCRDRSAATGKGTSMFNITGMAANSAIVIMPVTIRNADKCKLRGYKGIVVDGVELYTVDRMQGQVILIGNPAAGADALFKAFNDRIAG